MPEEENKKLRDLVSETLETKGVLGRIQAEIRASVFLALEERDVFKDKSPFINRQLKDYLKSSDGITVISLVREFLEFFNLEFASMVFDPETHAGLDYNYEGRTKLANTLNISDNDKHLPLLGHILKLTKSFITTNTRTIDKDNQRSPNENLQTSNKTSDGKNESSNSLPISNEEIIENPSTSSKIMQGKIPPQNIASEINKSFTEFGQKSEEILDMFSSSKTNQGKISSQNSSNMMNKPFADFSQYEKLTKESTIGATSLSSLSNLPPLGKTTQTEVRDKKDQLKVLLDLGTSLDKYDEDFLSSESEHIKKSDKPETGSEESEIEEEISASTNLSNQDDNTADITISRASGHGDYLESL